LRVHHGLTKRKYRLLFSPEVRKKSGPKGPTQEVMAAVVEMKQRNPTWGCPRIAQQIALAFGIPINKDVVRRILAVRYQPAPHSAGPSWLTVLGHAKDSLPESQQREIFQGVCSTIGNSPPTGDRLTPARVLRSRHHCRWNFW
jgi:hypothetical protein